MSDQQNNELDDVMRRVQKLLAIANDARANPAEASAAAKMAEKVMRKYQIDHADLIEKELRSKTADLADAVVFANMKRDDPKRPPLKQTPAWGQMLAVAIAQLHDCQVRQTIAADKFGNLASGLRFMGYGPDVKMCVFTFDYIVGTLILGTKQFNAAKKAEGMSSKVASESYRSGFTSAVISAVNDLRDEKLSELAALANTSRALVLVDTKKKVIEDYFGGVKYVTKKSQAKTDYSAFSQGIREGRKVDVNRRGLPSYPVHGGIAKFIGGEK